MTACFCGFVDNGGEAKRIEHQEYHRLRDKALSDFTLVVEETGTLDQGRSQKEKSR